MARKKTIKNNLIISDIAPAGKGVTFDDKNIKYLVTNTVPGDIVDIIVKKRRANHKDANAINFHQYSELRREAECKYQALCGGCKWQNLDYSQQLIFKEKITNDAFIYADNLQIDEIKPILGSEKKFFYRNKLDFTFSKHRWLTKEEMATGRPLDANGVGFHLPGMFDRVLDIDKCLLQSELSDKIRNSVKRYSVENDLGFYDIRNHEGYLRNLVVRSSDATSEYMVIVIFGYEDVPKRTGLLDFLSEEIPEISSLYFIINTKTNDDYSDLEPQLYAGKPFITEKIGDLQFRISPKSFFQTNSTQAKKLYDTALELADLQGVETVYDLYTGTGTIALYASQKAKKVVGVEIIEDAIEDAKVNAEINNIKNVEFWVGDMKDILTDDFVATHGTPDVVLLDPPRAGVHQDALKVIKKARPPKIVYISCNPVTQAKDIAFLSDTYKINTICPVDMFPHTYHIENIALLTINKPL